MDRINADLLRTFVEVAKVEHLSRAAEALQADQSTVSRKVARPEQEAEFCSSSGSAGTSASPRPDGGWWDGPSASSTTSATPSPRPREPWQPRAAGSASPSCTRSARAGSRKRRARFLEGYPAERFTLEEGTTAEVMSGVLGGTTTSASSDRRPPVSWTSRSSPLPRARCRVVPTMSPRRQELLHARGRRQRAADPAAVAQRAPPRDRRGLRRPGAHHPRGLRG